MISKLIASGLVLALVVTWVLAQDPLGPPQGGRRPGQPPGFGGPPGFGPPGFGPPGFGPPGATGADLLESAQVTLLEMPQVREELGITADQSDRLDGWIGDTHAALRAVMENVDFFALSELSEEDRQSQLAEISSSNDKLLAEAEQQLTTLLKIKQRTRLAELQLQRQGPRAFQRDAVAEKLGLSEDQRAKLLELSETAAPVPGGFGAPPDFAAIQRQREELHVQQFAVLTRDQRQTWNQMIGQPFEFPQPPQGPRGRGGPGRFGGPGGPGGRGGPGGFGGQERELVSQFDKNDDGWLNNDERKQAREFLAKDVSGEGRGGPGGFGPPRGRGGPRGGFGRGNTEPARPGERLTPSDVKSYPDAKLYDESALRTFFLEFENDDWEQELADFHNTDVEVPVTLRVDGKQYSNVGVHFRGMSSYGMVSEGYKRSLNLAVDFVESDQRLYGYKTLNLLNGHEDASFMSTVLYSHIARQYLPAPKANFVRVVINGENWGVYASVQQFNKDFLAENYASTQGSRWKVPGSPGARGGLEYLGDEIADYRQRFEVKSGDKDKAWKRLIDFCRILNETPIDQLPAAIESVADVDELLWFLAVDVALINNDGYWVRASDYSIYLDEEGKFHFLPHDMNEAFHGARMMGFGPPGDRRGGPPGGPGSGRGERRGQRRGGRGEFGPPAGGPPGGFGGAPGGSGVELDPLVGLDDSAKPLRSRILAVPEYRERYLKNVRTIAEQSLAWENLGPVVKQYRELIADDVRRDTRKLESFEAFSRVTADEPEAEADGRELPLRTFAEQRRAYLLNHPEIKKLSR